MSVANADKPTLPLAAARSLPAAGGACATVGATYPQQSAGHISPGRRTGGLQAQQPHRGGGSAVHKLAWGNIPRRLILNDQRPHHLPRSGLATRSLTEPLLRRRAAGMTVEARYHGGMVAAASGWQSRQFRFARRPQFRRAAFCQTQLRSIDKV
jgi:hypothetical protein